MILTELLARLDTLVESGAAKPDIRAAIATAHDSAQALESDERFTQLESQNAALKSQVEVLTSELQETKLTIDRLSKDKEKESADRPEPQHGLLVFINTHQSPSIEQIAQHLGMSEDGARFHLVELRDIDFVMARNFTDGRQQWTLAQEGRRYLADRRLLQ